MKQKTADQIEREHKNKIIKKQRQLDDALEHAIKKAEDEIDTKLKAKRDEALIKYTALQERNKHRALKNLAREEKWHKIVVYKKKTKKDELTKESILVLLQKYVRMIESNDEWYWECISCWWWLYWIGISLRDWKQIRANWWHYMSKQRNATAFDLDNIHFQCSRCNAAMQRWWKQGDIAKENYRKNLIYKIWLEKVLNLEANKSTLVDLSTYVTKENYEYWLAKVTELEQRKTLNN